jgi:branched-chain amino acid transport system ATP-binding protein
LLLLDEPSAGLNESETNELGALLRSLAADGLAVLLVEHDMGFVMGTCSRIHVLDFGSIIAVGTPAEIQADPMVRSAYLGSGPDDEEIVDADAQADVATLARVVSAEADEPAGTATPPAEASVAPLLELRGVDAGYGAIDVLFGVDLALYPGQVHALLGPNGAGKSTTLKVASAQVPVTRGEVVFLGKPLGKRSPDDLARAGLCLVPEGRGIFPNLTVTENLRMATYAGAHLKDVLERAFTRFPRLAERRKQVAGTLSGGEQQMLSMARAMSTEPQVLLLDELSMGLAPLVVEALYEVVRTIAAEGLSILIVEQFAHEVLGVASSASIMLNGHIEMTGSPTEVNAALASAYLGGTVGE